MRLPKPANQTTNRRPAVSRRHRKTAQGRSQDSAAPQRARNRTVCYVGDVSVNFPLSRKHLGLARQVMPGFGFIGMAPDFAMSLEVGATLDRLELAIEAPEPEFLSLAEITLHDAAGHKLNLKDLGAEIFFSTAYGDNTTEAMADRLLSGESIHSDKEPRPELRIALKQAVAISRISLSCTPEATPRRCRYLVLKGFLDGSEVYDYRNGSDEALLTAFAALCDRLGVGEVPEASQLTVPEQLEAIRTALLASLERGAGRWNLRQLTEFVPTQDPPLIFQT